MEQEHLDFLVEQSPVPIHMVTSRTDSRFKAGYRGYFAIGEQCVVLIEAELGTLQEKFFVLAHEVQHAECCVKGCQCFDDDKNILCEFHAFEGQLRHCMKFYDCLKFFVEFFLNDPGFLFHPDHQKARVMLKQTELWAEALRANDLQLTG